MDSFVYSLAIAAIVLALVVFFLFIYVVFIEPRSLGITELKIKNFPGRVVFLSDLHARPGNAAYLSTVAEKVNALNPDAVLLGGDLINGAYGDARALSSLSKITAKKYAVLGNHDYGVSYMGRGSQGDEQLAQEVIAQLNSSGVRVLRNEYVNVSVGNSSFLLIGLDDAWASRMAVPKLPNSSYTVFLLHEPDYAGDWSYDLLLSGHTHGGQVRLPVIGAPLSILGRDASYGLRSENGRSLYVSSGAGSYPLLGFLEFRFLMPPEIVLVTG